MANDVEIKGKVSVDTGAAAKQLSDLNKTIKEQKKIWKDAEEGSKEYLAAQEKLGEATKKYNAIIEEQKRVLDEQDKAQNKSAESFGLLKEKVGAMVPGLKGASEGVTSLGGTLKALALTPVVLILVAIVGALKLMYEAFKNTFEGGEKVEQIFAGIGAAGQALLDNLSKVGSIIKDVFTFNFSKAKKEIGEVADAATDAFKKMSKLKKESQELEREQADNDLDSVKRQRDLAILKEQAFDETVPVAKRKALLQDLRKASDENAKADLELAKKVADNKIAALTLQTEGEKKNYVEIQKIKADQLRGEVANANELRSIDKQITAANKAEEAERKQIQKDADDRAKESARLAKEHAAELKKIQEEQLKQLEALAKAKRKADADEIAEQIKFGQDLAKEQQRIDDLETKRLFDNEKTRLTNKKKIAELDSLDNPTDPKKKIELIKANLAVELQTIAEGDIQKQILAKKAADDITKVEKEAADAQIAIEQEKTDLKIALAQQSANALTALADVVGKQTLLGKGLAAAGALINTYQGIAAGVKLGFPAMIPAVAIAAATGFSAVRNILSTKVPGATGSSGPSVSTPAIATAPIAPVQSSTRLDQSSINAVGNAAAGGVARAFVLDSDINNAGERQRRIQRAARLG